jgi:hypothetical protein
MADCVQFFDDILQWNMFFTELVHDWEVELVTLFFNLL